jgi:hypothetical protein
VSKKLTNTHIYFFSEIMSFSENLSQSSAEDTVVILCGTEEATLVRGEYFNRSVSELFQLFADRLGTSADRILSYTVNGEVVSSDYVAQTGDNVRGVIKSDEKG